MIALARDLSYQLSIAGQPADADVMNAIQHVEVEEHAELADMLRLRLSTDVKDDGSGWLVLDNGTFDRLVDIELTAKLGATSSVKLFKGQVMEVTCTLSTEPGQSTVEVVAMDPTALMDLEETTKEWPNMADSAIATNIFGQYNFTPDVDTTQPTRQVDDETVIQRGTDISFLKQLAERNGFECYVETTDAGPVGHFHAPRLSQQPQAVLSVAMGASTTVTSFSGRYDMLAASSASISQVDVSSQQTQNTQITSASLNQLGSDSTVGTAKPRTTLLSETGLSDTGTMQTYAQGYVDRSSWGITAEGEAQTAVLGKVLRTKNLVLVTGAGTLFSGQYSVQRVLHVFSPDGYVQKFTLRRNALGLTGSESPAAVAV